MRDEQSHDLGSLKTFGLMIGWGAFYAVVVITASWLIAGDAYDLLAQITGALCYLGTIVVTILGKDMFSRAQRSPIVFVALLALPAASALAITGILLPAMGIMPHWQIILDAGGNVQNQSPFYFMGIFFCIGVALAILYMRKRS